MQVKSTDLIIFGTQEYFNVGGVSRGKSKNDMEVLSKNIDYIKKLNDDKIILLEKLIKDPYLIFKTWKDSKDREV